MTNFEIRIKKGDEIAMEISVRENRKGQSCKNRQSRATGNIEKQNTGGRRKRENKTHTTAISGIPILVLWYDFGTVSLSYDVPSIRYKDLLHKMDTTLLMVWKYGGYHIYHRKMENLT